MTFGVPELKTERVDAMELNRIGTTDLAVSRVGLGCNNFGYEKLGNLDLKQTQAVVDAALEAGINFFDTADSYGLGASERLLGEVLSGRRDRVVLATKFGNPVPGLVEEKDGARATRAYIRESIEGQLQRLQTDYIDLYYYHRPDNVTPLEETMTAMDELVREGKVRYVACSNFSVEQLEEAASIADSQQLGNFVALQNHYSLLERGAEAEVLPYCREHRIGFVPYFPLANGLLTGKYRRGEAPPTGSRLENRESELTDDVFDRVGALEEFASSHGRTLLELAIAGLASEPGVISVIAGATKPEQVQANAAAAAWKLSPAELDEIRGLAVAV
jgi:aryl-alcohol dehydrogenase-like predicted oxidoreductase